MQVVDILRSGALVVGFLSAIVGSRKDRNPVASLLRVDAISTGAFGLAWLVFPDSLLGYMVSGKLDPIHLMLTRGFGAFLLASVAVNYRNPQAANRSINTLIKSLILILLVMCMCVSQYKSQKDGKQKFNNQHLTFGIVGAGLWTLLNLLVVVYGDNLDKREVQAPLSIRGSCANACAFLDMVVCATGCISYLAFPSYALSFVSVEKFKADMVHAHMYRTLALFLLASVLNYMAAFVNGSKRARHDEVTRRLIVASITIPIFMAYQWWYQIASPQLFMYTQAANIILFLNICWAYYVGGKE